MKFAFEYEHIYCETIETVWRPITVIDSRNRIQYCESSTVCNAQMTPVTPT